MIEVEDEEGETSSSEEDSDEGPVLQLQPIKQSHPFLKLLFALWPFGEGFRELGVLGKIYEIVKASLMM